MTKVKAVNNDAVFDQERAAAGSKLLVIDFFAKWCGPCTQIAPKFSQLAAQYPDAVFLKVDVDVCKSAASRYNVRSMPTFVFEREAKVLDVVLGANAQALAHKLAALSSQSNGDQGASQQKGEMMDLEKFMIERHCLNESDSHPLKWVFEDNEDLYLESDCDPELLITLNFSQVIRLHSIKCQGPDDGSAPRSVRLFINQPNVMDFDSARDGKALQEIELTPEDAENGHVIPLKYVKLQAVNGVTLFVSANQGDEELTKVTRLVLYGKPVNTTNMGEFQRVAGKAGEAH